VQGNYADLLKHSEEERQRLDDATKRQKLEEERTAGFIFFLLYIYILFYLFIYFSQAA
jgi:hypothetical protein